MDSSEDRKPGVTCEPQASTPEEDLSELRGLLLGTVQEELTRIQRRLDDPRLQAEDMSRALPEAATLSSSRSEDLSHALVPTVEQAVRASVRKDPRVLVDALFPVMGPAIRKAIANALRGMVESLDKVLRQSLSIQGVRWRLEALRTGRSFAEVALLHSLVYRVEQVFLIHKQTGLLLRHLAADQVTVKDGDMVSGMLTAIQDFVKDSFNVPEGGELETLEVGSLSVFVEQGPQAVLAAVVRGNAPEEFRSTLQETLERIHLRQSEALNAFKGDSAPFGAVHDLLEDCLEARFEAPKGQTSPATWAVVAALVLAVGLWVASSVREGARWNDYLDRLRAEEGLVVTSHGKLGGKHYVAGLRDPLAADPAKILTQTSLNPQSVIGRWEPYESLRPRFVLARAWSLLQPSETVTLKLQDDVLVASGVAPAKWISEAARMAPLLPGISRFEHGQVLELEKKLEEELRSLEGQVIRFSVGSIDFAPGEAACLPLVREKIRALDQDARLSGRKAQILLMGHTDSSGTEITNSTLSRERAEKLQKELFDAGLKVTSFRAEGAGARQPLRPERSDEDKGYNRSVTFKISLSEPAR